MSTKNARSLVARAMRNMGYRDGLAGRPASKLDKDYQEGWRNGQRRRSQIMAPLTEEA